MTEKELRQKLVDTAKSYLGVKEGSTKHKEIIKKFNDSKLCKRYKMTDKDAWCQTYASVIAIICNLMDIIPVECSCDGAIKLWKNLGSWVEDDSYVPKMGDYIYYDWNDSGVGDNKGASDHVGIVLGVTNNTIHVIEGNKNNMVTTRDIPVNGKFIRGFGVPKYSTKATKKATTTKKETTTKPKTETKPKSDIESAKSKKAGLEKGKTLTTTENVYIRKGASKDKTAIKVLHKGTKVKWYGYYTKDWYLVSVGSITGFVCSKYLK